ncbi:PCSK9 [Branchiostoma lanceolatum]|uniref:PCSK9 protein n=1 Tax=Branchiostoma lanceolatum TaxID=7740 RepID=A0A8J9VFD9_BRALA|nr:PCSK9 [Branchiostoma lanceolatum]
MLRMLPRRVAVTALLLLCCWGGASGQVRGRVPGLPGHVTVDGFDPDRDQLRPVVTAKEDNMRVPGSYIVVLRDMSSREEIEAVVRGFRATAGRAGPAFENEVDVILDQVMTAFVARLSPSALRLMQAIPGVDFIEEDQIFEKQQAVPWHLDRIDQKDLPVNGQFSATGDGSGVDVYVLDSGIRYSHEEFEGRASFAGFDAFDPAGTNQGQDIDGHGTHVAALVGGKTYGVARNVQLKSVRVLDEQGRGRGSTILAGLNYVRMQVNQSPNARAIAVMSLAGSSMTTVNMAAKELVHTGCAVFAAAGNAARDACRFSPAGEAEVITVGGTNAVDGLYRRTVNNRLRGTNYGRCVDIMAPAQEVVSADVTCDTCSRELSGTSQATPLVAGVAATILQQDNSLTPAQLRMKLLFDAATNRIDFTPIPDEMKPMTPNKLLYIPQSSAFTSGVTPTCRTVWSLKSDTADGELATVRCNINESMMGCSSVSDDGLRAGEFTTALPGDINVCIAQNGIGGTGVFAMARCCVWPGSECYFEKSDRSSSQDGARANIKCERNDGDLLTSCSAATDTRSIDGARPASARLRFVRLPLRTCIAQNGDGGNGVEAHATCCKADNMDCKAVWSNRSPNTPKAEVSATCPTGWVLTGCNAYDWSGHADGSMPIDNTCIARKGTQGEGVHAVAICCRGN